jgi:uncharacterized membrane protein HdeD (DUF308 family)
LTLGMVHEKGGAMSEPRSLLAGLERGAHLLSAGLIALGVLAAVVPALAGAPVVIIVGGLLALAGGARAYFGWGAWSAGKGPRGLVVGGLALACGLALVLNPVSTLGAVSLLVAAYLLIDGVAALLFAGGSRETEGRAWLYGEAIMSIVLGVSMWIGWPLSGLRALGVLVGAKLVSAGVVVSRVEHGLGRVQAGVAAARARLDR